MDDYDMLGLGLQLGLEIYNPLGPQLGPHPMEGLEMVGGGGGNQFEDDQFYLPNDM